MTVCSRRMFGLFSAIVDRGYMFAYAHESTNASYITKALIKIILRAGRKVIRHQSKCDYTGRELQRLSKRTKVNTKGYAKDF